MLNKSARLRTVRKRRTMAGVVVCLDRAHGYQYRHGSFFSGTAYVYHLRRYCGLGRFSLVPAAFAACLHRWWLCGRQVEAAAEKIGRWTVEIIKRSGKTNGFQVLSRRWDAERTFAWLGTCPRLAKDAGKSSASLEALS
jgi:hypothetical protein